MMNADEAFKKLLRGCVDCHTKEDLKRKLASKPKLRVKLGVDPTSPDLHLGHTVVLNRLRAFQDLGHIAVLIIGDFTAQVGDPSGRDSTRPTLSYEEIRKNAETFKAQALRVLDSNPSKIEFRFNSEWLKGYVSGGVETEKFSSGGLLSDLKRITVAQLLQREDFSERMSKGLPLSLLEMLYPVFQGYDSVIVKADVELGGTDQLFNLLMGRNLQMIHAPEEKMQQVAMTFPLLVGTDGVKKMSKSYGNSIALNDAPRDMFGKLMRISDDLMMNYYELLTDHDLAEVKTLHPMDAKKNLAEEITTRYHGIEAARSERQFFENTFSRGQIPTEFEIEASQPNRHIVLKWQEMKRFSQILTELGLVESAKQAQRLIEQRAFKIAGIAIENDLINDDWRTDSSGRDHVLQVGKHKFYKVHFKADGGMQLYGVKIKTDAL